MQWAKNVNGGLFKILIQPFSRFLAFVLEPLDKHPLKSTVMSNPFHRKHSAMFFPWLFCAFGMESGYSRFSLRTFYPDCEGSFLAFVLKHLTFLHLKRGRLVVCLLGKQIHLTTCRTTFFHSFRFSSTEMANAFFIGF